jgi:5'-nucleotidase
LHSNDLHGDFLAERIDEKLIGGVSMMSGYVGKVRQEEKNSIYFCTQVGLHKTYIFAEIP